MVSPTFRWIPSRCPGPFLPWRTHWTWSWVTVRVTVMVMVRARVMGKVRAGVRMRKEETMKLWFKRHKRLTKTKAVRKTRAKTTRRHSNYETTSRSHHDCLLAINGYWPQNFPPLMQTEYRFHWWRWGMGGVMVLSCRSMLEKVHHSLWAWWKPDGKALFRTFAFFGSDVEGLTKGRRMNFKFSSGAVQTRTKHHPGHLDFVVNPQESRCKSSFAEVVLLHLREHVGVMLSCLVLCRGVILVSFVVNFEELGDGRSPPCRSST